MSESDAPGTVSAPLADPADNAWASILARLAVDREALVDDFLERLSTLDGYTGDLVPDEDLRQTAGHAMDMLIHQLAGLPLPAHLRDHPARLGVRRARQGVRRESMLEAVRLDFRVLWAGLVRAVADDPVDTIVLHTEELLSAVERYIDQTQAAFLAEEAALARDSRLAATRAFARLLNAGEQVEAVAAEVAEPLGMRADATFEVALVHSTAEPIRLPALSEAAPRHLRWDFDEGFAVVREQRHGESWMSVLSGVSGGYVGNVAGLAAVPAAVESARVITRHSEAAEGRLATEPEVWLSIAAEQLTRAVDGFGRAEAESLAGLPPEDRRRLLCTVFEYSVKGSIKSTAARLYCHRNTVVNRLRVFQELTGFDMLVPLDAARALVVFGAEFTRLGLTDEDGVRERGSPCD